METLIVSAKPSHILIGKIIGAGAVGLTQVSVLMIWAVAAVRFLIPAETRQMLNIEVPSAASVLLIILFFILSFALFSCIQAVCGATVSKMEDLQQAMMPSALLNMFSFYASYMPLSFRYTGGGGMSAWLFYVPFTAPYAMAGMLLGGEQISPITILLSLVILILSIVLVGWICAKIYTASVLHYGTRLRLKDMRKLLAK